jgi:hypothetical protein
MKSCIEYNRFTCSKQIPCIVHCPTNPDGYLRIDKRLSRGGSSRGSSGSGGSGVDVGAEKSLAENRDQAALGLLASGSAAVNEGVDIGGGGGGCEC